MTQAIAENDHIIRLCQDPSNPQLQAEAVDYLKSLQEKYPYYENLPIAIRTDQPIEVRVNDQVVLVDNGEFLVDTAQGTTIGRAGPTYSYIQEVFEGKPYYISEIYHSITRGNPIFVISAPIIVDGQIIGASLVSPKMNYITELFVDHVNMKESGYMFLIDSSDQTIAHKERDFILSHDTKTHEIAATIRHLIDQGKSFFEADLYQSKKYYYGKKINLDPNLIENELYLVVSQKKSEVYKRVYAYALLSLITVFSLSLILYKLLSALQRSHYMRIRQEELVELNQQLDAKVRERTHILEEMTKRDSMTGLYNHAYIYDYLNELPDHDLNQVTLALVDIDDFKSINDTYGHQAGDQVIRLVAQIMESRVSPSDLVGRYGGEEFIIITQDLSINQAWTLMDQIRSQVYDHAFQDINQPVSISIGLAQGHGHGVDALIKSADDCLYRAKALGKNRIHYTE